MWGGEDHSEKHHLKKIPPLEGVFFLFREATRTFSQKVATATGVVLELQSIPTLFVTDMLTKKKSKQKILPNTPCSNWEV